MPILFFSFLKENVFLIFLRIFSFSLTWDPMGAKISKRYSYKSQPKVFKLFLNFLPNGLPKTTFGIFEILKIEILTIVFVLLTWGPMRAKISKRYTSYKSQEKTFKPFLNFLHNGPHKTTFGIFEILKIEILTDLFFRFR